MLFDALKLKPNFLFDADGAAGGGDSGTGVDDEQPEGGAEETVDYEQWVSKLKPAEKAALEGHTRGLKSALDSERASRKSLEKQLRDLAKASQEGSDAQKKLVEMADKMAEADRRADFYDSAHAAGVTNLKLAYLVAVQDELFDRRGGVDFTALRTSYPELFGQTKKVTKGNAGSGTDETTPTGGDMNAWIRQRAGRR